MVPATPRPSLDLAPRPGAVRGGWLVTAVCLGVLSTGWWLRDEQYLTPEHGLGYALGIIGSTAMLSILIYSARKRWRALRGWGGMKHWLRAHIAVGLAGPLAILFHANFQLGSTNSTVAIASMLLVAGSGLVGRFLYGRVHQGLYGRQLELGEIWQDTREQLAPLREILASHRELIAELEAVETWTRERLGQLSLPLRVGRRARLGRRLARTVLPSSSRELVAVERYLDALLRVAQFALCERMFRLWHALHVPLFATLIATLVIHVIAVHLY